MSEFTPGPWNYRWDTKTDCGFEIYEGINQHIAYVVAGDPPDMPNARLISAAPELLEACKLALNALEKNWAIDWNILEEAINKAEGKK